MEFGDILEISSTVFFFTVSFQVVNSSFVTHSVIKVINIY